MLTLRAPQKGIGSDEITKGMSLHPFLQILTCQAFLYAPFLAAHLCHGADPLDVPDGLGLQVRTSALTYLPIVVRKQVFYSKCSASVSVARTCGGARLPLRVPIPLGNVSGRKALV